MSVELDSLTTEVAAIKVSVAAAVAKIDELASAATVDPAKLAVLAADLKTASDSLNASVAAHPAA